MPRPSPLFVAALLALLAAASTSATAASPASPTSAPQPTGTRPVPENQLLFRSTNIVRYNPLGLMSDNQLSLRHLLYRADDDALRRDNFVGLGITPQFSAAFTRLGVLAEVQPLSILRLWVHTELVGYYGAFGLLQSFSSPHADFAEATLSERGRLPEGDPQKNFATWGAQLALGADAQVKVGPVVARNLFRLIRGSYRLRDGDSVYYDQYYDVLAPNDGAFVNNDTDLLYFTDNGLVAGARMNVTQPFYGPEHYSAAERASGAPLTHDNGPTLRAGPLLAYTFFDDPAALLNKPTLILIGNWWLAHRYRTGVAVPQATPYVVVAFQVSADLMPRASPERRSIAADATGH
jgi:hypothetical protein